MVKSPTFLSHLRRNFHWIVMLFVAGAVLIAYFAIAHSAASSRIQRKVPEIDLADTDPDIAAAINDAISDVMSSDWKAGTWGRLAMTLHAHGYFTKAEVCYSHASDLDTKNPQWPYLQAICAARMGSDTTVSILQRSVRLQRDLTTPRLLLAETLFQQGHLEDAKEQFNSVLILEPKNVRALLGLGRIAMAYGDASLCAEHLQEAVRMKKDVRECLELLAAACQALGDHDLARIHQAAAKALPNSAYTWPDPYQAQVALLETGIQAINRRANQRLSQGDAKSAIEQLEALTHRHPNSAEAWAALGRIQVLGGSHVLAIESLNKSLALNPNASIANYFLGAAQAEIGLNFEAAEAFRRSIAIQPNFSDAHFELAKVLRNVSDAEGATDAARQALRYNPHSALAAQALGVLLAEQGRLQDAMVNLRRALQLAPDNDQIKQQLAKVEQMSEKGF